eukprot:290122-Pyramimonas_sp.AAC.1
MEAALNQNLEANVSRRSPDQTDLILASDRSFREGSSPQLETAGRHYQMAEKSNNRRAACLGQVRRPRHRPPGRHRRPRHRAG